MTAEQTEIYFQELNDIVNEQIKLRDKLMVYIDDWATLPTSVKTALKARVSTKVGSIKTRLDAFNTSTQAL